VLLAAGGRMAGGQRQDAAAVAMLLYHATASTPFDFRYGSSLCSENFQELSRQTLPTGFGSCSGDR
jgi:hypothetical protein